MSREDQNDLLKVRTELHFGNDMEFLKNTERKDFGANSHNLLQLGEEIRIYPEARPIGEMLAQIGDPEDILEGAGLNDAEDARLTLESLESAEKLTGEKMPNPEVYKSVAQIRAKGSLVENLIQDNGRISGAMLDAGIATKEEEKPKSLP